MTRQVFGRDDAARDQAAAALRDYFVPGTDLEVTRRQLARAVRRRTARGKRAVELAELLELVERASRPVIVGVQMYEVFDQPEGGDPIRVALDGGTSVSTIPAGAQFRLGSFYAGRTLYFRPVRQPDQPTVTMTYGAADDLFAAPGRVVTP